MNKGDYIIYSSSIAYSLLHYRIFEWQRKVTCDTNSPGLEFARVEDVNSAVEHKKKHQKTCFCKVSKNGGSWRPLTGAQPSSGGKQNVRRSKIPPTLYSKGLQRVLRCALALASSTISLELEFRSGNAIYLDMLLDGPKLYFNDKWLDFDKSHEDAPCSLSFAAMRGIEMNQSSCAHILSEL